MEPLTLAQKYTGRSMKESHAQLKISSKEWGAFLDDFSADAG